MSPRWLMRIGNWAAEFKRKVGIFLQMVDNHIEIRKRLKRREGVYERIQKLPREQRIEVMRAHMLGSLEDIEDILKGV